jgi:tetratricopeptide (TPR) repeat protein
VGAFLGFLLGVFLGVQGRGGAGPILLTTFLGWALSFFVPLLILRASGRAGSILYAPSGRSTPHKKEYSLAESFAVRGRYHEAVDAFEAAIREDPADPIPYLRVARVQRDRLGDDEEAARWFNRALSRSEMHPGLMMLTRNRELRPIVIPPAAACCA